MLRPFKRTLVHSLEQVNLSFPQFALCSISRAHGHQLSGGIISKRPVKRCGPLARKPPNKISDTNDRHGKNKEIWKKIRRERK